MKAKLVGAAGLGHEEDSCGFSSTAVRGVVSYKAKVFPVCDARFSVNFIVNLVGAIVRV